MPTHRLNPYNHFPPWRHHVTAIIDTLPIFVSEPSYFQAAKLIYQPKYKRHCYKMQLAITFMGNIVLWTGPHLGCSSDLTIWRRTWANHPLRSWEAWLADLGYVGAAGLIYKFKKPAGGALTRAQRRFNNMHECTRNRVENVVRRVKGHRLFSGRVYKGTFGTLRSALKIIGHVAAYELRQRQRFRSFGPWPHAYGPQGHPNPP